MGKTERINKILDEAEKALKREKAQYFIGAINREEGMVHTVSDLKDNDIGVILHTAMPTRRDLVNLGLYVGGLLSAREKHGT